MSLSVSERVRNMRLPATMRRRVERKAVLLALADRCDDQGRNAWPSLARIAAESEICESMARHDLRALRQAGFIREQARARQHRPRTWSLNLTLIDALRDQQAAARYSDARLRQPRLDADTSARENQSAPLGGPEVHATDARGVNQNVQGCENSSQGCKTATPEVCDRTPERSVVNGPVGTVRVRARATRPQSTIIHKPKGYAAFKGPRVYVPRTLHDDFVRLRNHGDAERELLTFYEEVSEIWTDGPRALDEPGADMFAFWRARYNERWPPADPGRVERGSTVNQHRAVIEARQRAAAPQSRAFNSDDRIQAVCELLHTAGALTSDLHRWFRACRFGGDDGTTITIVAPNAHHRELLAKSFGALLERVVSGRRVAITAADEDHLVAVETA